MTLHYTKCVNIRTHSNVFRERNAVGIVPAIGQVPISKKQSRPKSKRNPRYLNITADSTYTILKMIFLDSYLFLLFGELNELTKVNNLCEMSPNKWNIQRRFYIREPQQSSQILRSKTNIRQKRKKKRVWLYSDVFCSWQGELVVCIVELQLEMNSE